MAQVAFNTQAQAHAALLLDSVYESWTSLPRVAQEIDAWDLLEQIVFIEEWPLVEERLRIIESYLAEGVLSPEQIARYEKLMPIIARNRPLIEQLRNS